MRFRVEVRVRVRVRVSFRVRVRVRVSFRGRVSILTLPGQHVRKQSYPFRTISWATELREGKNQPYPKLYA